MKAVKFVAIGAAGLVALVGASAPAAAQYPGYGYGGSPYGYGQYGYPPNVIGQVLQSILNPYGQFGYGGYGVNPQIAVNQCTAAVQQRLQGGYGYGGYGGYGGGYGGYGAYGGYGNPYSQARVLGITRVEQRSATTLRVRGYATSGLGYPYGGYPYGGHSGYGYGGPGGYGGYGSYGAVQADLSFRCDVDYRGYIRNLDIDRRR
jgi:hypothetical protein